MAGRDPPVLVSTIKINGVAWSNKISYPVRTGAAVLKAVITSGRDTFWKYYPKT